MSLRQHVRALITSAFRQSVLSCSTLWLVGVMASIASAHPGHSLESGDSTSIAHYATHPDHLTQWLAGLAVIMSMRLILGRILRRRAIPAPVRLPANRPTTP